MKDWVVAVARFGYFAYGIVYIAMGVLALRAASGPGSPRGAEGTITYILYRPFGKIVLIVIALGLIGYVVWRFVQAVINPEKETIVERIGNLSSGLVYAGVCLYAFRILTGSGARRQGSEQAWTATVMSQPVGEWLVVLIGIGIIGSAFYQFYEALTAHFRKKLSLELIGSKAKTWIIRAGRFGAAARGVLFFTIGYYLFRAGLEKNPRRTVGVEEALQILSLQPDWFFYFVALGLAVFGVFALAMSRYRRIRA
jgi:hypothetical protein